jgi:hypothetical protein
LIASAAWHQPVILWDVQTGRTVARLADHTSLGPHMRFSADGKTLATAGDQGTAGVWDVTTGKLVQQFALPPDGVSAVLAAGGGKLLAYAPAESENGEEAVITVWDLVAGRIARRFNGHATMVNGVALSADGRMLASRSEDRTIRVWEAASGAERVRFADRGQGSGWTGTQFLAFAPDGRTLATCGPADSVVRLWDLTTGNPLPPLTGHLGWVGAVEFSTDGRTLISGSQDSSILAWDVTALARREGRAERRMSADEARKKWDELREPDAARAYRAMWDLVAAGDSAVEFLRGQLHPAVAVDPQQLARWIRDLDHPQYAARERATASLAQVADQAESALRAALVRTTSAEVRQRIRRILDTGSEVEPSPDRLREARAVEALELSASPAAGRFLTHLAEGAPEATLTRDAAASLKRFQARRGPENADR